MVKDIMADYRQFKFTPASQFRWSPHNNTIYFTKGKSGAKTDTWSLLHELGHATLGHHDFGSDLELIKLERAAWDQALVLASRYNIDISQDYIEDCMDTYRRWIARRSRCPVCDHTGLQLGNVEYTCVNCGSSWQVSLSQACKIVLRTTSNPV